MSCATTSGVNEVEEGGGPEVDGAGTGRICRTGTGAADEVDGRGEGVVGGADEEAARDVVGLGEAEKEINFPKMRADCLLFWIWLAASAASSPP